MACSHCGRQGAHELEYAGRLLASVRCRSCGYMVRHETHDLREAYVRDLEQRIASKPCRMWHRAIRDPLHYLLGLPGSFVAKPKRMLEEIKPLLRR